MRWFGWIFPKLERYPDLHPEDVKSSDDLRRYLWRCEEVHSRNHAEINRCDRNATALAALFPVALFLFSVLEALVVSHWRVHG